MKGGGKRVRHRGIAELPLSEHRPPILLYYILRLLSTTTTVYDTALYTSCPPWLCSSSTVRWWRAHVQSLQSVPRAVRHIRATQNYRAPSLRRPSFPRKRSLITYHSLIPRYQVTTVGQSVFDLL